MAHPPSDPTFAAATPVLLSTQPNTVQWPTVLPPHKLLMFRTQRGDRGGVWSAWRLCAPRGRSLFGSRLRLSVSVPATHVDGRLEVRAFVLNGRTEGPWVPGDRDLADEDEDAYAETTTTGVTPQPAGPVMVFILLNNPIVVEEALMFLDETSNAGGTNPKRSRPRDGRRSKNTARGGPTLSFFPSFFRSRSLETDEGTSSPSPSTSGRVGDDGNGREDHERETRQRARSTLDRSRNQTETPSDQSNHPNQTFEETKYDETLRDSELNETLTRMASLMFDDRIDAVTLRTGCEDAARAGLLHLLRLFGNKAIQTVASAAAAQSQYAAVDGANGVNNPAVTLLENAAPPRTMNNVAACGCAETLRTLVRLIGMAEDCAFGSGDLLFGNPEVSCDSETPHWLPLHTAAVTSAKIAGWDSVAAVEFVCMMIGCCSNPMTWMGGVRSRRRRRGLGISDGPRSETSERSHISSTSGGPGWFKERDGHEVSGTRRVSGGTRPSERDRQIRVPRSPNETNKKASSPDEVGFPNEYAPNSVCLGVRDFYEAAVTVAVVHAGNHALDASTRATAVLVAQSVLDGPAGVNGGAEYLTALGALVRPTLRLDDVIEQCMSSSLSDSRLNWMACNLLSDDKCRATLLAIYDDGAHAAVWRAFPQQTTVRALMHALGWLDETSAPRLDPDADAGAFGQPGGARDARGGSDGGSFFGSDTAGPPGGRSTGVERRDLQRKGSAGRRISHRSIDEVLSEGAGDVFDRGAGGGALRGGRFGRAFVERVKRWCDTTARPIFQQTPWNTQRFGLMTFKDKTVETEWMEEREVVHQASHRKTAFWVGVCFLGARLVNGDVGGWSVFYAFDGHFFDNITTHAQRFHTVLFALTIAVLTSKTNLLVRHVTPSKKHWLICGCRLLNASFVNLPEVFPSGDFQASRHGVLYKFFDIGPEAEAPNTVFDPEVWRTPAHVARFATAGFNALLPFLVNVSFAKHVLASVACSVATKVRFGTWHGCQNIGGFDGGKDMAIRATLFITLSMTMYVREYHDRFSFLMRYFAPGKRKAQ